MSPVLLLVDVHRDAIDEGVAAAIGDVLVQARNSGVDVVHVRDAGADLAHDALESEHVVDKQEPDAFAGTDLAEVLPADASLVLVGRHSIRATALSALARGHDVTLVSAAHDEEDRQRVEDELAAAGVAIVDGVMFGEFAVGDSP
jgi:nicotinamidase-related amidase